MSENRYDLKIREVYEYYYGSIGEEKKCKYSEQCSASAKYHCGYRSSFAARVGENYGVSIPGIKIPRIVIIGKENRYEDTTPNKRPARLKDWNNSRVNRHYIETFKQLKALLNFNTAETKSYKSQNDCILTCFALSNIYRCAFKEYDDQTVGIKNSAVQKACCSEILRAELAVLEPEIILLQNTKKFEFTISPEAILPDCRQVAAEHCKGLYYSETTCRYIIVTAYPAQKFWNDKECPWNHWNFERAVLYLRSIGAIPDSDTTKELTALLK